MTLLLFANTKKHPEGCFGLTRTHSRCGSYAHLIMRRLVLTVASLPHRWMADNCLPCCNNSIPKLFISTRDIFHRHVAIIYTAKNKKIPKKKRNSQYFLIYSILIFDSGKSYEKIQLENELKSHFFKNINNRKGEFL